ncbi:MAG: dihydropteroate synthase [Actinomycetota bacterium]|nr:dihydropteroate synthase [Actinomycetota bacterium]
MGVLNVTPDSFSDGGRYAGRDAAVRRGEELFAAGADIVDVGGESTRPGAARVDADEEAARVLPVVTALASCGLISIDTTRAVVAQAAVRAGARLVNDVSGGLADPAMTATVAAAQVVYVVMHTRGPSRDMQDRAVYDDVVADVVAELTDRVSRALAAGVDEQAIVVDPGLGFAKTAAHNWSLLARLSELFALGRPVLVGPSRKSFLGTLLGAPGAPRPVDRRDDATAALSALSAAAGAWGVRVHEVAASADAVRVVAAVAGAR